MHKYLCGDSDVDVIYRTKNIHTKEMRFIHFFADVPHLVKTVRNFIYHSGSGWGKIHVEQCFFSFMVTYSFFVL